MSVAASGQTFTNLADFNGEDGAYPELMSLVQGIDGNLYGTTYYGGANNYGAIFKVTPAGTLTGLHSFCAQPNCTDGSYPVAGLLLGTDETFYGTTSSGGNSNDGIVFKATRSGVFTVLHSFAGSDGAAPQAALIEGTDGNLYGTTTGGGQHGYGTVFKITPEGMLTTLHSFDSEDGSGPAAALVQGTDGDFYGTTTGGGADGYGTIFKITPGAALKTLHSFNGTDGADPLAPLIQASNGNLYGTAASGGSSSEQICQPVGCGTIFKLTTAGALTVLHNFQYYSDGAGPAAPLIIATDGNLYGATAGGTAQAGGTVFMVAPGDAFMKLHVFGGPGSGSTPLGGLLQATNGILYGTTEAGEIGSGDGTVFSEALGVRWFVTALPTARKVGQSVIILGTDLTGSTSVTFNGTPAAFTVVSATEITTSVPAGATTGMIEVATPIGLLKSNVPFRVLR